MCRAEATYGPRGWKLPPAEIRHPINLNYFRCFAVALLSGEVCEKLKKFVEKLLARPETMTKEWARLQKRTDSMLNALTRADCKSRFDLEQNWETDSSFLLNEYLEWVPEKFQDEVRLLWPPLVTIG